MKPRQQLAVDLGATISGATVSVDFGHGCLMIENKIFAFTRSEGWVGFTLAGCPLGEGLLDYAYMRSVLRPDERHIHQIVEKWMP